MLSIWSKVVRLALVFCFVGVVFSQNLLALSISPSTNTPRQTLQELMRRSSLIVIGTVGRGESRYVTGNYFQQRERAIVTDTAVQVSRTLKGANRFSQIVVETPGGCGRDGVCVEIDASPSLTYGESVILFLAPMSNGKWGIVDVLDGKQSIRGTIAMPLRLSVQEIVDTVEGRR